MRYLYRVLYKKFVIFKEYGRFITNITCTGYKSSLFFKGTVGRFITNIISYTEKHPLTMPIHFYDTTTIIGYFTLLLQPIPIYVPVTAGPARPAIISHMSTL